jgi:NarL family two-component system response regulator YdfI
VLDRQVAAALTTPPRGGLAPVVELIRSAMSVDRVSIATFSDERRSFLVVASSGRSLFAPGTELPMSTSTQILQAAARDVFLTNDFAREAGWRRPTDRLVCAVGFRSGCTVPLVAGSRVVGAVSLSSTTPADHAGRVAAVEELGPLLAVALASAKPPAKPPVLLVCHGDDLAAEGLAHLAERELGARVWICSSLDDAAAIAAVEQLDLVLCDGHFDGRSLDDVVLELRSAGASAPLVLVPTRDTADNRVAALRIGAAAYVPRAAGARAITTTLEAARRGQRTLPRLEGHETSLRLTRRERELLVDLDRGLRFKQIAARMGISETTVKGYARALFRKLGSHSRGEAVYEARSLGFLDPPASVRSASSEK